MVVLFSLTYLEELDSDTSEHEIQQHGDQDDVADGFDGHEHALDHVLPLHKGGSLNIVFCSEICI